MKKSNNKKADWKKKLKALLHDPPHKAWVMFKKYQKHEAIAKELFESLFYGEKLEEEEVRKADATSSALSRIVVSPEHLKEKQKKELLPKWEELYFIDLFSGETEAPGEVEKEEIERFFQRLGNELSLKEEERAKFLFLFLWRFYLEVFPWMNTHPADTRAPNHSIYDHLVQTSAVVSAFPWPAFLLFTISPVQNFITTARKTQDLWAGSYLLSYLIWKSMLPIIDKLGPDNIIFPNLLRQPLMDFYLRNLQFGNQPFEVLTKEIIDENINFTDTPEKLTIANLPNRFLAIIPFDRNIAEDCERSFKKALNELAEKISEKLIKQLKRAFQSENTPESLDLDRLEESIKTQIKSHLFSYFQVYWAILPWCEEEKVNDVDTVLKEYKELVGETHLYQTVKLIVEHPYYKPANIGSAYSLLLELIEKLLAARKSIRNTIESSAYTQEGEKCTLCGEFVQLSLRESHWKKLEKEHIVRPNERLCGVCVVKRLFSKILKDELEISNIKDEIFFPSVAEIASIGFKRILTKEEKEKLKEKFEEFKGKVEAKGKKLPPGISVPKLKADPLSQIDGMFLMEPTYRKEFFEEEYGITLDEEDFEPMLTVSKKLKEKGKSPSTYYAILQIDGDNIGKWLKGEFNPKIEEVILSRAKDVLLSFAKEEERKKLEELFCKPHPSSPSIHQMFSRKLSEFALSKVREIVEDLHYGKLIYAGGDDVLAFLPIEEVLSCTYELQKVFKEILSDKASMSAGIVIPHYKYPLYLALSEVREAEKKAKNEFGKNAFCIKVITHSGETRLTGGKWGLIEFLKELICKFKTEEISSRFPYEFLEVVENFVDNNTQKDPTIEEILIQELKRIYERKTEEKEFFTKILEIFKTYPFGYKNFANLLVIARFLAKESRI